MSIILTTVDHPDACYKCPCFDGECSSCNVTNESLCDASDKTSHNCPLKSVDGLIKALNDHFADEDGIAVGEYWKHEEVIKVIKAYCKGE